MDINVLKKMHFDSLRVKYKVGSNRTFLPNSFLYLILRKADLGMQVTDVEHQWLAENRLSSCIDIISLQQYKAEEEKRIEAEVMQLRAKYLIPDNIQLSLSSSIYSVLWKLEIEHTVESSDLELLNADNLLETVALIQDIVSFSKLKTKFKATQHLSLFPEKPLYLILKKLDGKQELSDFEAEWLLNSGFEQTLEIYWQQENIRKAKLEFLELKSKYQVTSYQDNSISSKLYSILKKMELGVSLDIKDGEWLKKKKLNSLIKLDEEQRVSRLFIQLKEHYQASQHPDIKPFGQLFKVLIKIAYCDAGVSKLIGIIQTLPEDLKSEVREKDINWLTQEGLCETAEIACKMHFQSLRRKYQIIDPNLAIDPFYGIMVKLEREERLDPKQVVQLIEERRLSRHGKIAIAYYRLEAIFYEKEYKRTGNKWNLPSASSNWRKADESEKALEVTKNVNWNQVREADLKSALLVTRGAAFRDLSQLDEAESCATQAMESQPDNHQPYTLMGAICYDLSNFADGDTWFEMAAERGADDTDDEIERIVRMTKDKNQRKEVVEYLLNKDRLRYAWAKSYLK
ncbi:MAG: hypothetical protein WBA41_01235 [Rivularia sp. (in: cyanobacteria)]